jgi:hypothetical protein
MLRRLGLDVDGTVTMGLKWHLFRRVDTVATERKRLSTYLPPDAKARAKTLAKSRGVSVSALLQQAIRLMALIDDAMAAGQFVGIATDRANLETVLVPPPI